MKVFTIIDLAVPRCYSGDRIPTQDAFHCHPLPKGDDLAMPKESAAE